MGQELFQHGNLEGQYIHRITRWRFVNTEARMDPSNMFTFRDLDKVAYDEQTKEYYVLHRIDSGFIPVWKLISAVEAQGESNALYTLGTGVSLNGPKVGTTLGIKSIAGIANQIVITELPDGTVRLGVSENLSLPFSNLTGVPSYLPSSYVPPLATSSTDGTITSAMFVKINNIAPFATANDSDTNLRNRTTHTGTQDAATTLSGLSEAVQDIMGASLVAGSNIGLVYNDSLGTIQINFTGTSGGGVFTALSDVPNSYIGQAGLFLRVKADQTGLEFAGVGGGGGGGGSTNLSYTASPTNGIVGSDTGTDAIIPVVNSTNAGLMSPIQNNKLSGIADNATANTGTVTSVTVITANGFSGSVATGTTTPAITLNLQDATSTQSGKLSAADWATFNAKQPAGAYITENQTITLSGDITGSGTTSITTSIANDAVTFAKMQNITSARLLGRGSSGTGDVEEIVLGSNLSLSGNTLNATGGGGGGSELPGQTAKLFWDFPGGTLDFEGAAFTAIASGTSGTAGTQAEEVGAWGTRWISSSSTANSGSYFNPVAVGIGFWLVPGRTVTYKGRFYFPSTLIATTKARFGFQGAFNTNDESSEVSFVVDAGNIVGRCRNSGTQVGTTTLGSVTTNAWVGFKIVYTSTAVEFSVYNSSGTLVATETLTTGIPTNISKPLGTIATSSGTTAGKILGIDYIYGESDIPSRAF